MITIKIIGITIVVAKIIIRIAIIITCLTQISYYGVETKISLTQISFDGVETTISLTRIMYNGIETTIWLAHIQWHCNFKLADSYNL
jgi:hypothetical protein